MWGSIILALDNLEVELLRIGKTAHLGGVPALPGVHPNFKHSAESIGGNFGSMEFSSFSVTVSENASLEW